MGLMSDAIRVGNHSHLPTTWINSRKKRHVKTHLKLRYDTVWIGARNSDKIDVLFQSTEYKSIVVVKHFEVNLYFLWELIFRSEVLDALLKVWKLNKGYFTKSNNLKSVSRVLATLVRLNINNPHSLRDYKSIRATSVTSVKRKGFFQGSRILFCVIKLPVSIYNSF